MVNHQEKMTDRNIIQKTEEHLKNKTTKHWSEVIGGREDNVRKAKPSLLVGNQQVLSRVKNGKSREKYA